MPWFALLRLLLLASMPLLLLLFGGGDGPRSTAALISGSDGLDDELVAILMRSPSPEPLLLPLVRGTLTPSIITTSESDSELLDELDLVTMVK